MTDRHDSSLERTDPVGLAAAAYRERITLMRDAGMHVDATAITTDRTRDEETP